MTPEQNLRNREYLAAIALLSDMFEEKLVNEMDYSALELKFASFFIPLFRYEKPCFQPSFTVRQSGAALP